MHTQNMKTRHNRSSMERGMKYLRETLGGASVIAILTAVSLPASAQQLDYGSYELLFGEEVTKGATGTPQRLSDVSADMIIITQEDIRNSGMRNIPEILREVAGIDVQRTSPISYNVSMRGYNRGDTDRLRVLIDGRDTFRPYNGTTRWSSIPVQLAEIRQIEVVRGPATALYGANAVAGVINIVTYSALYDDVSNVTGRIGLDGIAEASMVHTFKFPNDLGGLRVSAGYFEADKFDEASIVDDGALVIDAKQKMANVDGWFKLAENVHLGIGVHALSASTNIQEFSAFALAVEPNDISYKATLSAETGIGLVDITAYVNDLDEFQLSLIATDSAGNPVFVEQPINSNSIVVEASDTFKFDERSTIRFSAGYRKDEVVRFPTEPDGKVGYNNWSLGALWDFKATDKLSTSASIRYDWINPYYGASDLYPLVPYRPADYENFGALSFNFSALYRVSDKDALRFNIGRGVDTPSAFELGGYIFQNFFIDETLTLPGGQGNPFVRESYSTEYELKWDHRFDSGMRSSMGLFYQRMTGYQGQFYQGTAVELPPEGVTANWPIFTHAANILNGDMFGGFIELSGKIGENVKWDINYAFHDIDDDPVEGIQLASDFEDFGPDWAQREFNEDRTSKHVINGILEYETGKFRARLHGQYKSKYHSFFGFFPSEWDIDSQFILNASLQYQVRDWARFVLSAENLTDAKQLQASTPTLRANRQVYMGLQLDF